MAFLKSGIEVTYNATLRSIMNKKRKDRIRTNDMRKKVPNSRNFLHEIRTKKMGLGGTCGEDNRR